MLSTPRIDAVLDRFHNALSGVPAPGTNTTSRAHSKPRAQVAESVDSTSTEQESTEDTISHDQVSGECLLVEFLCSTIAGRSLFKLKLFIHITFSIIQQ